MKDIKEPSAISTCKYFSLSAWEINNNRAIEKHYFIVPKIFKERLQNNYTIQFKSRTQLNP